MSEVDHNDERSKTNECLQEKIETLNNIISDIACDCEETTKCIDSVDNEELRQALIYELQRQKLKFRLIHAEKVSLLHEAMDNNESLITRSVTTPKWNESSSKKYCAATTSYSENVNEKSETNSPFQRATIHRTSRMRVKVRRSSGGSNASSSDESNFYSSQSVLTPETKNDSDQSEIKHDKPAISSTENCDSVDSVASFLLNELPTSLVQSLGDHLPFNHFEETDINSTADEIIVLGVGPEGPSANALITRQERIIDERKASNNEIRFIHEHTRKFRVETIVHLDDESLLEWAKTIIAQREKSTILSNRLKAYGTDLSSIDANKYANKLKTNPSSKSSFCDRSCEFSHYIQNSSIYDNSHLVSYNSPQQSDFEQTEAYSLESDYRRNDIQRCSTPLQNPIAYLNRDELLEENNYSSIDSAFSPETFSPKFGENFEQPKRDEFQSSEYSWFDDPANEPSCSSLNEEIKYTKESIEETEPSSSSKHTTTITIVDTLDASDTKELNNSQKGLHNVERDTTGDDNLFQIHNEDMDDYESRVEDKFPDNAVMNSVEHSDEYSSENISIKCRQHLNTISDVFDEELLHVQTNSNDVVNAVAITDRLNFIPSTEETHCHSTDVYTDSLRKEDTEINKNIVENFDKETYEYNKEIKTTEETLEEKETSIEWKGDNSSNNEYITQEENLEQQSNFDKDQFEEKSFTHTTQNEAVTDKDSTEDNSYTTAILCENDNESDDSMLTITSTDHIKESNNELVEDTLACAMHESSKTTDEENSFLSKVISIKKTENDNVDSAEEKNLAPVQLKLEENIDNASSQRKNSIVESLCTTPDKYDNNDSVEKSIEDLSAVGKKETTKSVDDKRLITQKSIDLVESQTIDNATPLSENVTLESMQYISSVEDGRNEQCTEDIECNEYSIHDSYDQSIASMEQLEVEQEEKIVKYATCESEVVIVENIDPVITESQKDVESNEKIVEVISEESLQNFIAEKYYEPEKCIEDVEQDKNLNTIDSIVRYISPTKHLEETSIVSEAVKEDSELQIIAKSDLSDSQTHENTIDPPNENSTFQISTEYIITTENLQETSVTSKKFVSNETKVIEKNIDLVIDESQATVESTIQVTEVISEELMHNDSFIRNELYNENIKQSNDSSTFVTHNESPIITERQPVEMVEEENIADILLEQSVHDDAFAANKQLDKNIEHSEEANSDVPSFPSTAIEDLQEKSTTDTVKSIEVITDSNHNAYEGTDNTYGVVKIITSEESRHNVAHEQCIEYIEQSRNLFATQNDSHIASEFSESNEDVEEEKIEKVVSDQMEHTFLEQIENDGTNLSANDERFEDKNFEELDTKIEAIQESTNYAIESCQESYNASVSFMDVFHLSISDPMVEQSNENAEQNENLTSPENLNIESRNDPEIIENEFEDGENPPVEQISIANINENCPYDKSATINEDSIAYDDLSVSTKREKNLVVDDLMHSQSVDNVSIISAIENKNLENESDIATTYLADPETEIEATIDVEEYEILMVPGRFEIKESAFPEVNTYHKDNGIDVVEQNSFNIKNNYVDNSEMDAEYQHDIDCSKLKNFAETFSNEDKLSALVYDKDLMWIPLTEGEKYTLCYLENRESRRRSLAEIMGLGKVTSFLGNQTMPSLRRNEAKRNSLKSAPFYSDTHRSQEELDSAFLKALNKFRSLESNTDRKNFNTQEDLDKLSQEFDNESVNKVLDESTKFIDSVFSKFDEKEIINSSQLHIEQELRTTSVSDYEQRPNSSLSYNEYKGKLPKRRHTLEINPQHIAQTMNPEELYSLSTRSAEQLVELLSTEEQNSINWIMQDSISEESRNEGVENLIYKDIGKNNTTTTLLEHYSTSQIQASSSENVINVEKYKIASRYFEDNYDDNYESIDPTYYTSELPNYYDAENSVTMEFTGIRNWEYDYENKEEDDLNSYGIMKTNYLDVYSPQRRKISGTSVHSLSSIPEEDEESYENLEKNRKRVQSSTVNASTIVIPDIVVVDWIEPELEFESCELDKSEFLQHTKTILEQDFRDIESIQANSVDEQSNEDETLTISNSDAASFIDYGSEIGSAYTETQHLLDDLYDIESRRPSEIMFAQNVVQNTFEKWQKFTAENENIDSFGNEPFNDPIPQTDNITEYTHSESHNTQNEEMVSCPSDETTIEITTNKIANEEHEIHITNKIIEPVNYQSHRTDECTTASSIEIDKIETHDQSIQIKKQNANLPLFNDNSTETCTNDLLLYVSKEIDYTFKRSIGILAAPIYAENEAQTRIYAICRNESSDNLQNISFGIQTDEMFNLCNKSTQSDEFGQDWLHKKHEIVKRKQNYLEEKSTAYNQFDYSGSEVISVLPQKSNLVECRSTGTQYMSDWNNLIDETKVENNEAEKIKDPLELRNKNLKERKEKLAKLKSELEEIRKIVCAPLNNIIDDSLPTPINNAVYEDVQHIDEWKNFKITPEPSNIHLISAVDDNEQLEIDIAESKAMLCEFNKIGSHSANCSICKSNILKENVQKSLETILEINDLSSIEDSDYSARKIINHKRFSLPEYIPPPPVILNDADLATFALMSPTTSNLQIFNRYLLNINQNGGPHTWHVPYFLVPREHELLGQTWPMYEIPIPDFLKGASTILRRRRVSVFNVNEWNSEKEEINRRFELTEDRPQAKLPQLYLPPIPISSFNGETVREKIYRETRFEEGNFQAILAKWKRLLDEDNLSAQKPMPIWKPRNKVPTSSPIKYIVIHQLSTAEEITDSVITATKIENSPKTSQCSDSGIINKDNETVDEELAAVLEQRYQRLEQLEKIKPRKISKKIEDKQPQSKQQMELFGGKKLASSK